MSKQDGLDEAIKLAIGKLQLANLEEKTDWLGISFDAENNVQCRAFGKDLLIDKDYSVIDAETGKSVKPADQILVLHYLLHDLPIKPTGELIAYRDFPGGQFYLEPFLSRTVKPLVKRFQNDLDSLRKGLEKFDWEPVSIGDFGARINAVGKLDITLVYRLGDDEFPPDADVFFDSSMKKVFEAEDAAVLASRICLGIAFG